MTHALKNQPPPLPARMTYEEFLRWDGENQHVEWVDGEVVPLSPVSMRHQLVAGFMHTLLHLWVEHFKLGHVLHEPFQMKTGPRLPGRAPDVLFVAHENSHRLHRTYLEGPADLVVEVVSPDDPKRDTVCKFREYEQGGVREYWLVDPEANTSVFYIHGPNGKYEAAELDTEGRFHSTVLKGLWVEAEWLKKDPLPSTLDIIKQWGLV